MSEQTDPNKIHFEGNSSSGKDKGGTEESYYLKDYLLLTKQLISIRSSVNWIVIVILSIVVAFEAAILFLVLCNKLPSSLEGHSLALVIIAPLGSITVLTSFYIFGVYRRGLVNEDLSELKGALGIGGGVSG